MEQQLHLVKVEIQLILHQVLLKQALEEQEQLIGIQLPLLQPQLLQQVEQDIL